MSSLGEKYASIAAKVVKGELDEQAALAQFVEVSDGRLDDFTALGVLELHLEMASGMHDATGQTRAYSFAVRQLFKKKLALGVYEGKVTLDDAALQLAMTVPQVSVVLGAHHSLIYGLPIREHMHELSDAPVDTLMRMTQSMTEKRARYGQPPSTVGNPPGHPTGFPNEDPPTTPIFPKPPKP